MQTIGTWDPRRLNLFLDDLERRQLQRELTFEEEKLCNETTSSAPLDFGKPSASWCGLSRITGLGASQQLKPTIVSEIAKTVGTPSRKFTRKQMGDACEMLVAAELTLAGIPALKVPDNWPHYDVIAQPVGSAAQRISVKSRTYKRGPAYVEYKEDDQFDWLAIVLLNPVDCTDRSIYLVPRTVADGSARQDSVAAKTAHLRYYRIDEVERLFFEFRNNFELRSSPGAAAAIDLM